MANTKLADMTATTTIAATDLLYVLKDPAGTPLDRKATGTTLAAMAVAAVIAAAADTQVLFMDGTGISGDAGLTYNKTTNALSILGTTGSNTGLLVDAVSGFTGVLANFKVNATTVAYIRSDGLMQTPGVAYSLAGGGSFALYGSGLELDNSVPISWGSPFGALNLTIRRDADNVLAQRNSTAAQAFRVYNTFTDASNYERAGLGWASNVFTISTDVLGTGTLRGIDINPSLKTTTGGVKVFSASAREQFQIYSDGNDPVIGATGAGAIHFTIRASNKYMFFDGNGAMLCLGAGSSSAGPCITFYPVSGPSNGLIGSHIASHYIMNSANAPSPLTLMGGTRGLDEVASELIVMGSPAARAAATNLSGAPLYLRAGQPATGGDPGTFNIQSSFRSFGASQTAAVTITNATPAVITWTAHGLVPGQVIRFTTTGTLPTGLSLGANYWVSATGLTVNTFQVSATWTNAGVAGASVATSSAGSGTHTATCTTTTTTAFSIVAAPIVTFGPSGLVGSLTTPAVSITQTWNTSGAATALVVNVTNIASNNASMLLDLQVNGVSKTKFLPDGSVSVADGAAYFFAHGGFGGHYLYVNTASDGAQMRYGTNFADRITFHGNDLAYRSDGTIKWSSTTSPNAGYDLVLARDAAGVLAQRNSTNAQAFRVYNTFTDASNYERGYLKWSSNILSIGTEKGGTGVLQRVNLVCGQSLRANIDGVEILYMDNGGVASNGTLSANGQIMSGTTTTGLLIRGETAQTNTVNNQLIIRHNTYQTPAAGIGVAMVFQTATVPSANHASGGIIESICTDVTGGSLDFDLSFKVMANSAAAAEKFRILSTGQIIQMPPSSVAALTTNGQMTVEATANTTLTFKYRGSDGTTRSATVTLA